MVSPSFLSHIFLKLDLDMYLSFEFPLTLYFLLDTSADRLGKAYRTTVACLGLIVGIAFLIYGIIVVRPLLSFASAKTARNIAMVRDVDDNPSLLHIADAYMSVLSRCCRWRRCTASAKLSAPLRHLCTSSKHGYV